MEVNGKSTSASVDLSWRTIPRRPPNSAVASTNNATLATVAATYGLRAPRPAGRANGRRRLPGHRDRPAALHNAALALKTTSADASQLIATALLPYVQQAALDASRAGRAPCKHFASCIGSPLSLCGLSARKLRQLSPQFMPPFCNYPFSFSNASLSCNLLRLRTPVLFLLLFTLCSLSF